MRCVSCNEIELRKITPVSFKCDKCDIVIYSDEINKVLGEAGSRDIENYEIVWETKPKKSTIIYNNSLYEEEDDFETKIAEIDGCKLFDVRTKEQLEKLLLLL
jgi:predicted transcriptional regulator